MSRNVTQPISDFNAAYGNRLRTARMNAGLSQTELGELVDLTRSSIANVEAGRQASSAEQAVRIANALGVGVQWLLTGDAKIVPAARPVDHRRWLRTVAANLREVVGDIDAKLSGDP